MEKEPHFGFPPGKSSEELIAGLQEAVEATKRRIAEHKANKWDFSEFEFHLKSLEQRLDKAQKKIK